MIRPRAHLDSGAASLALAVAVGVAAGRPAGVLLLPILSALLVPFASSSPRGHLGFTAALGVAVGGAAWGAATGLGVTRVTTLFMLLAAFGLFAAAACSPTRARRASPGVVLLSGAVPSLLLLSTVWYVDPLVLAVEGNRKLERVVIATAVGANPILVLSQHVGGEDLLHAPALYGRSAIGDRFFTYPPAWQPTAAFAAVALALVALARLVVRPDV